MMKGTQCNIQAREKKKIWIPEHLQQVWKGFLHVDLYEEVPQNEQYDQFSLEIGRRQHRKDNMQHSLEQNLSFYPCQVNQE